MWTNCYWSWQGRQFTQPTNTNLHEVKNFPGWILSHTHSTLEETFKRHICHSVPLCCAAVVKGPCILFYFILFFGGWTLNSLLHYSCVLTNPAQNQEPAVFLYQYCCKATENCWKWKVKSVFFYALGEHLKSWWAALCEQSRWRESSLWKVVGLATSSLYLVSGRISFWTLQCFQIKRKEFGSEKTAWHFSWS